ncbi:methionyl-tRNA formyltransferase [Magnetospirillum sulfuroxidans]|uniref:Methionyl-tRNA formyltransferase n=1 Tax=Magnetospirillum sulfuroxidans TaxID=611300 RepID=A0ABS5IH38_9PROT|nr:formyltransferase family protein [Magnetospirillum sulfuroxidans]MBR9973730.1 hypothetical protein [Magnetospirillum sulfuroxidans]
MKAAFIGCVDFSHDMLTRLLARGVEVVGVVTRRASSFNADFRSLAELTEPRGIPCLFVEGNDQNAITDAVRTWNPDVIFCLGWSFLLKPELLALPRFGVIGYHPAQLPRNRGRHPLIWALALGLDETGSTFFLMDDGADSGDIISQRRISITEQDDAASLYRKITDAAEDQLDDIILGLISGRLDRRPQDHARATYWRKRSRADGQIDWRMPVAGIRNLVRALNRPYVGAHCIWHGQDVKVWHAEPAAAASDLEPGRVIEVVHGDIVVKCGDGAVRLVEHEFPTLPHLGECL